MKILAAIVLLLLPPLLRGQAVVSACSFQGAGPSEQIQKAFASLPNQQGTVDLRCFGAQRAQPLLTAPLTIGPGQFLQSDRSIYFRPNSPTADVVHLRPNGGIDGFSVDLSNYSTTYAGKVISEDCESGALPQYTAISHIRVTGAQGAPGYGLWFNCSVASGGIAGVHGDAVYIVGLHNPLVVNVNGKGSWFNGNRLTNLLFYQGGKDAMQGIQLIDSGLEIRGNAFSGMVEGNGAAQTAGLVISATGEQYIQANRFDLDIWDVTHSWISSGKVTKNRLTGNLDGVSQGTGIVVEQ